jgi:hypothetical protein
MNHFVCKGHSRVTPSLIQIGAFIEAAKIKLGFFLTLYK